MYRIVYEVQLQTGRFMDRYVTAHFFIFILRCSSVGGMVTPSNKNFYLWDVFIYSLPFHNKTQRVFRGQNSTLPYNDKP